MLKGYFQDKYLDVFLLSFLHLTINNIDYDNSKPKFIHINQQKTGDLVVIPILKPTQNILEKYKYSDDRVKLGKLIPKISNVKLKSLP